MAKNDKMTGFCKGAYCKPLTLNLLAVEEPLVPDHLVAPAKNQDFLDVEEINKYNYYEKFDRKAHKANDKVPVLMQVGRNVIREGHVIFEER